MRFTKIPETTFQELQLNAGILVSTFNAETAVIGDILGATSGGVNFNATPSFVDFGEDIDNCPKNTKELKKLQDWEITMGGTFASVTAALAKRLVSVADLETIKVVPRDQILLTDYADMWWIGDYSDKNGDATGGFVAIHMMNVLSTGGFQIQTADKEKGKFAFTFTAHYSIDEQETVPFEIYVKSGTA